MEGENPNDFKLKGIYDRLINAPRNKKPQIGAELTASQIPAGHFMINNNGKDIIVYINTVNIQRNVKYDKPILPTYIIKLGPKEKMYTYSVDVLGPSKFVDSRTNAPMHGGARVWLVTSGNVIINGMMDYAESEEIRKTYEAKISEK